VGQRAAKRRLGRSGGLDHGRKSHRGGVAGDKRSDDQGAVGACAGGAAIRRGIGRRIHGGVRGQALRPDHPVMARRFFVVSHSAVTAHGFSPGRMGRAGADAGAGL